MRSLPLLAAALILLLAPTPASARIPRVCRTCRAVCADDISACIAALTPSCPQSPRLKAKRCRRKTKHQCRKAIKTCCVGMCTASGSPVCCGAPSTTTTTLPGGNPCFTDGGDGTVHDTCTGLQWEKKQGQRGLHTADLHDINDVYPWAGVCSHSGANTFCQPDTAAATTCAAQADGGSSQPPVGCSECPGGDYDPTTNPGGTGPCEPVSGGGPVVTVWAWLNQVNAANFAGHGDWRIPSQNGRNSCPPGERNCMTTATPRELETILEPSASCGSTCTYPIFGVLVARQIWSASTNDADQRYAWVVDFSGGLNDFVPKDDTAVGVRAVRTDQ